MKPMDTRKYSPAPETDALRAPGGSAQSRHRMKALADVEPVTARSSWR